MERSDCTSAAKEAACLIEGLVPPSTERRPGKYERLARDRQARELASPRGFHFDQAAADRVVAFIEKFCKHHEGEWGGKPIKLEEWQKRDVIGPIFGWKRADGTRRFRTAYIEIPRKNGKSFLCSAFALYLLIADGEPGAQVYSSATKEEQAAIVWRGAMNMVKASPDLQRFTEIHGAKKKTGGTIFCERTGGFYRPLGADSTTLDGLNPHAQIIDELHEHKDRRVWSKLQTATGARRQPLTLAITTAGVFDQTALGWQQHKYAQDLLDGAFADDSYFAFIAAADDEDEVFSVETQMRANPNFGVSAYASKIADAAKLAERSTDDYNDYLRYHLNRWTQQVTRWLSPERWAECDPTPEPREQREEALAGRECSAGLDLSSKLDLAALVLAFLGPDDVIDLLCRFWLPEERIAAEARKGRNHYARWVEEGWITTTPGEVVDYGFIRAEINLLSKKYRIGEIAFDPWNAQQMATELGEQDGFEMVETRQGFASLSEPSKAFEARIVSRKLRHGGNPVLTWNVGNAVVRKDPAGNIKPDKEKATDKIDGVLAAIMACGRAVMQEGSVYTPERGFLSL
jgi:phage terminase large subunit-like protein